MKHKVIGLISGGKDSLYSLAHCVANGHEVIALANLHPPVSLQHKGSHEEPDLDSFMYQTVGHSVVHLYADALELPLYRRTIVGFAHQTARNYDTSSKPDVDDETEDMYLLIQDVLKSHPEATALSAGAILSTYQRTRVESIALRLGLCPLAYLWQYPALPPGSGRQDSLTGLLDDMALAGCDARIIKVASGGIPATLMSTNVTNQAISCRLIKGLAPFFDSAESEFELRGAVLGEGGEYETLALAGPSSLWKKRLVVEFGQTDHRDGGTYYAELDSARIDELASNSNNKVPVPAILDRQFEAVLKRMDGSAEPTSQASHQASIQPARILKPSLTKSTAMCELNNLSMTTGESASEQLENIIVGLPDLIAKHYQLPVAEDFSRRIASVLLTIKSMNDFADINRVYSKKLWPEGLPLPPARVTISSCLPGGVQVAVSMVLDLSPQSRTIRTGLHVQSLSYWAPANIGPYSQAVNMRLVPLAGGEDVSTEASTSKLDVVYMAGQIPLLPANMTADNGDFCHGAVLALQHLWRVAQERNVDMWTGYGIAYLANSSDVTSDLVHQARLAAQVWQLAHHIDNKGIETTSNFRVADGENASDNDESTGGDEDYDVWDARWRGRGNTETFSQGNIGNHLHPLPRREVFDHLRLWSRKHMGVAFCDDVVLQDFYVPMFLAAQVTELPRKAAIEWSAQGVAGLHASIQHGECALSAFEKRAFENISLSGILLSHCQPSNITDQAIHGHLNDSTHSQSFTLFVTVIVHRGIEQQQITEHINSPPDLLRLLFKDSARLSAELVSSQVWLNLGTDTTSPDILACSQLLSTSSVVQCHRCWAGMRSHLLHDDAAAAVEEVAALAICRIDVMACNSL